ncbi:anthranilate synthase component I [Fodinicurvata halophila]|uniref:Anthranilate synthase component 1 n=1 Tax=Fodinicurvata halophila TaxID=1419723 RepID=A0ABV8UJH2_9PROT
MQIHPAFETFRDHLEAETPQLVWTTLVTDLETPVSAFLKLAETLPYSFLFESVEGGSTIGRYSFITLKPDLIWRARRGSSEINRTARVDPEAFERETGNPLENLKRLVRECEVDLPEHLPPMATSLIGYVGYDMVRYMEKLPDENPDSLGLPESIFVRPTVTAVFDRVEDVVTILTPVWPNEELDAEQAYDKAIQRLQAILEDFDQQLPRKPEQTDLPEVTLEVDSNIPKERYLQMVEQAREYIAAGDIYQVVLGQRFSVPFDLPSFSLYRALRRLNPSPFLFYLNFGDFSLVGSSPEILVRLRNGTVTIRPLAGTRKRGSTPSEDRALAEELLNDPKERAEHLMLLDLGRNDVGRVSRIGTVKVTEQFTIEHYSHVMHISSNVEGEIAPQYDAIDALMAGFPAGTVSGAPKVRAMEIIEELESDRRGFYAGAIGYFGAKGSMDTCIALRTALVKDGRMYVQAGAGVVIDSDPESEYQECRNKARALIRAAEEALRFARRN